MADPLTNAHIREDIAHEEGIPTTGATSSTGNSNADTAAAKAQATLQNARDSVISGTQAAVEAIQKNPTYQQLSSGPLAENVRTQASLTSSEFSDLANAKNTGEKAATGQSLTHYHSRFYKLLSWENPRATAIVFASSIAFIFLTRYLNLLHYVFKFSYIVLGITAALEIAGKLLFDDGLASKMRPRRYYTIPRQSLEASLDEVAQLLNFFVIEAQRILYAENVYATVAVFFAALLSYGLIKIVPTWGLALLADTVMFLAPLVYVKNREVIDHQVEHATDVINQQTHQLRDLAVHHASVASKQVQNYTQEYTNKASEFINQKTASVQSSVNANTSSTGTTAPTYSSSSGTTGTTYTSSTGPTGSTYTSSTGTSGPIYSSSTGTSGTPYSSTTGTTVPTYSSSTGASVPSYSSSLGSTGSSATVTAGNTSGAYSTGPLGSTTVNTTDFPTAPSQDPAVGVNAGPHQAQPAFM